MNVTSTSHSGQQHFSCLLLTLRDFFLPHFDVRFMLLTKLFRQMTDDGDDTMTMTTTTSVCKTKRSSSATLQPNMCCIQAKIYLWNAFCGISAGNLIFIGFLCFFMTLSCVCDVCGCGFRLHFVSRLLSHFLSVYSGRQMQFVC